MLYSSCVWQTSSYIMDHCCFFLRLLVHVFIIMKYLHPPIAIHTFSSKGLQFCMNGHGGWTILTTRTKTGQFQVLLFTNSNASYCQIKYSVSIISHIYSICGTPVIALLWSILLFNLQILLLSCHFMNGCDCKLMIRDSLQSKNFDCRFSAMDVGKQWSFRRFLQERCSPFVFKHAIDGWPTHQLTADYFSQILGNKKLDCKISVIQYEGLFN